MYLPWHDLMNALQLEKEYTSGLEYPARTAVSPLRKRQMLEGSLEHRPKIIFSPYLDELAIRELAQVQE